MDPYKAKKPVLEVMDMRPRIIEVAGSDKGEWNHVRRNTGVENMRVLGERAPGIGQQGNARHAPDL